MLETMLVMLYFNSTRVDPIYEKAKQRKKQKNFSTDLVAMKGQATIILLQIHGLRMEIIIAVSLKINVT